MQPRITMLGSHEVRLTRFLDSHPFGHERAAIVLFRRFGLPASKMPESDRYVAVDTILFEDNWVTSSSASHVAFDLKYLRDLFRRCDEESLVFGFIHNHPGGPAVFSDIDDVNEETLLTAIKNRNGPDIHFIALLWSQGTWKARVRSGTSTRLAVPARHILIIDRPIRVHLCEARTEEDEVSARQAAAFGKPFVEQLRSLRVAIVGAGGTGSPVVTMLSRAGVGEIIVIDGDSLERSNLNRVRGARLADVGKKKAEILRGFVDNLGLSVSIVAIDNHVDLSPQAVDALSTCDVVFGCTDDQIGRETLNAALYVYALAYIDVGLGGQIREDNTGQPNLRYHYGRVSTILPESGECLFCQGVLTDAGIRTEYAMRENPNLSEVQALERYLERGGEQAPGVGPFTSAVADYGVATLFDLIRPFRKFPPQLRRDAFTIDFVRMQFRSVEERHDLGCIYCGQRAYLLKAEEYRLNRPALGKRSAAI